MMTSNSSDKTTKLMRDTAITLEEKDEFDLLNKESYGEAMDILPFPERDVLEREKELRDLSVIMNRPETPIAILLGRAGVGKTATVETWAKRQYAEGEKVVLLKLKLGKLSADGTNELQGRMETLLWDLKKLENKWQQNDPGKTIVLFMDEIQKVIQIFGTGTKIGGDLLKDSLARNTIKVITATTRKEYDQYISSDEPLARRLKPLEMNEVTPEVTQKIIKDFAHSHGVEDKFSDEIIEYMVEMNRMHRRQFAEPAASIDVMEQVMAYLQEYGRPMADMKTVNAVFREFYNISLDFDSDIQNVEKILRRRIKGQPLAIDTVMRGLRTMLIPLETSDKPRMMLLFAGPTGVGKTEMTKALNEALYDGAEDRIHVLNMENYGRDDAEVFRRDLGTVVSHTPDAIVLLDELEKADRQVIYTILEIGNDGIVNYRTKGADGMVVNMAVSMRNSILIATTNSGKTMFAKQAEFSNNERNSQNANEYDEKLYREAKSMRGNITQALSEHFPDEIQGRFTEVVPFFGLSEATKIEIAENKIKKINESFKELHNIEIQIDKPKSWGDRYKVTATDIAMFAVYENGSQSTDAGGAREVVRSLEREYTDTIRKAIVNNPGETEFYASVNDGATYKDVHNLQGQGRVIVKPLNQVKY